MFHLKNHPAIGDPPFYEQKKASQKPWDTEGSHMEIIGFNPSPIRFHLFNLVIFRDQRWIYWMVHWIGLMAYFMGKPMLSGVGFPWNHPILSMMGDEKFPMEIPMEIPLNWCLKSHGAMEISRFFAPPVEQLIGSPLAPLGAIPAPTRRPWFVGEPNPGPALAHWD